MQGAEVAVQCFLSKALTQVLSSSIDTQSYTHVIWGFSIFALAALREPGKLDELECSSVSLE